MTGITEYEFFKSLLKRQNIPFEEDTYVKWPNQDIYKVLIVERGYSGFVTRLEFDNEDKFIDMGAWE